MKYVIAFSILSILLQGCAGRNSKAGQQGQYGNVATNDVSADVTERLSRNIYYSFDRDDINADGVQIGKDQAEFLKSQNVANLKVEGHCDERGTDAYNLALGNKRAVQHKKLLLKNGVKAKIRTVSFGKRNPEVQNASSELEHAKNRKSTIVVE